MGKHEKLIESSKAEQLSREILDNPFHKDNIFNLCQDFDVVIAYGDIAWLKLSTLPFYKKSNK